MSQILCLFINNILLSLLDISCVYVCTHIYKKILFLFFSPSLYFIIIIKLHIFMYTFALKNEHLSALSGLLN